MSESVDEGEWELAVREIMIGHSHSQTSDVASFDQNDEALLHEIEILGSRSGKETCESDQSSAMQFISSDFMSLMR
jgi:hypothetical protein